tara:strand:- start:282 stop:1817 length:1536 start_codon:yes stop_codon:yes gene_type:complete
MKKIAFLLSISLIFVTSCETDFELDEKVYSNISPSNFYKSSADADAAIAAIYNAYNRTISLWDFGLSTSAGTAGHPYFIGRVGWRNIFNNYTVTAADGLVLPRSWNPLYQGIFRANVALANMEGADFPANEQSDIDKFIGEAKYLRAWAYFHLTQLFGNVPMPLAPAGSIAEANLPASTRASIYAQIVSDLQAAEAGLPNTRTGSEKGRPNAGSAKFLLGKVYLTMAGAQVNDASAMQLAHTTLKGLIDNAGTYGFELLPSYADAIYNDNNAERVFAIQQTQAVSGQGTAGTFVWGGIGSTDAGVPRGQAHGGWTCEFYDMFEATDTRRDVTMLWEYEHFTTGELTYFGGESLGKDPGTVTCENQTWGIHMNKFKDADQGCCDGDPDVLYYRFSDALLMFAEAENSINGPTDTAYEYINMVRERGGASALVPGSHTQAEFAEAMYNERLFEFTFECMALYDTRRLGKVAEVIAKNPLAQRNGTTYSPYMEVWPIPIAEINANSELSQNEGW